MMDLRYSHFIVKLLSWPQRPETIPIDKVLRTERERFGFLEAPEFWANISLLVLFYIC